MSYSQSHFLRDNSTRPPRRLSVTPPPSVAVSVSVGRSGSSETGNISPTIRRWQTTFQVTRLDRYLLNEFFRRLHTRGGIFARFFLLRLDVTVLRVVRQELRQLFTILNLPPRLLPDQHIPARYRIHFINSVKSPTFTTDKGDPILVGIYDSYTQKISPDCPFSSAKVRITVLDAEFWKNKGETWSRSEFNDSILSDRVGKGPILRCGGRTFQLKDGEGASEEISFGDNSSWTKSGFRLGVMVEVEQGENGERVQEGVSTSLRVLDRRGKASQKPNKLKLEHKVQNLKKIGKDRASRLENNEKYKINTVEDFLILYYHDQSELREILGIKSESDKEWKTMVKHAMECDNEFHAKNKALKSTSQPQQVSMDKEVNILNPNTNQFYYEYPIDNNMNFASPLEADVNERTSHHFVISSELLVHTSGNNGLCFVGSGSSEPNPCENHLINPGLGQLEIPSASDPMEVMFPNAEGPPAEYEAWENSCLPQQALGYPLERNTSPLSSGGPLVPIPSSLESNSHENNVNYQGGISACYEQLSPICDLFSIVSNEQISAAFGEHPVETQSTVFHEINARQELRQVFTILNLPPRLLPDQHIPARYLLRFINSVKSPTFTTDKGDPILVGIYDSYTQKVSPDCPFSSAKVRIIVLDAEFWKNKGETWSRSKFNDSILSDRVGKGPILRCGGRTFQLKDGEGASEEISFGDNSSWTKSGFRLGVMVEVEREENGERVQEGVSASFRVLDRRGKASQKPNQLKLEHKVQNLKKIGKDRASRLENNKKYKINTVEDFLRLYYHDQSELREILGIKSESDKEWKTMVKHAMECANEFLSKNKALKSTSQPQQVSMDKQVNILIPNTNQFYCEYPIENNMNFASPLEADVNEGTSHHLVISSELLVHTSGSNGLCFVGSGSSEPNPCENYLINPGLGQLEIPSDSVPMEVLFPNAESNAEWPPAEYEAWENTCLPQQALGYPLERNASLLPSGGPLVLSPSSLESNSHENNVNYQGGISACYEQLSPICDLFSIVSNEQISAAFGEHPVETQSTVFHEINYMTIQTGNMLNVNSMQRTNADGSPQLSSDVVPMEYFHADAESDYIRQVPLIMSSSVYEGEGVEKGASEVDYMASCCQETGQDNTSCYPNNGASYVSWR